MLDIRRLWVAAVVNLYLDATRIPNPTVQEADSLQDRANELQFIFKATINQFAAGVPMGKVSIETQLRKAVDQLYRTPQVLENCRAVRFWIQRHAVFRGGVKYGVDQHCRLIVIFNTPPHMQSQAFQSGLASFFR